MILNYGSKGGSFKNMPNALKDISFCLSSTVVCVRPPLHLLPAAAVGEQCKVTLFLWICILFHASFHATPPPHPVAWCCWLKSVWCGSRCSTAAPSEADVGGSNARHKFTRAGKKRVTWNGSGIWNVFRNITVPIFFSLCYLLKLCILKTQRSLILT